MEAWAWLFLTGGLFLGWSLGGNDGANIFGTAVGTRMVRFSTAAFIAGVFVTLGAVLSGAGTAGNLGKLGSVGTLLGAFLIAVAAAYAVYLMNLRGLPVSTSQTIVGAIFGWNVFAGRPLDLAAFGNFLGAWVVTPFLAAAIAALLYLPIRALLRRVRLHLLTLDLLTRYALIAAGAFGAYSLGANNIANVVGVFMPLSGQIFRPIALPGGFVLEPERQLLFLGGLAITVGIYSSYRVMMTVGRDLARLNPLAAWVVVVAQSLVLLFFASQSFARFVASLGLPPPPLVPVSSSQAVVGAVVGLGLLIPGSRVEWRLFGRVATGWVLAPATAALLSLVALYVAQNVFNLPVLP